MDTNELIEEMHIQFDQIDWANAPMMKIAIAARDELAQCGMSPTYRDMFVARMEINVGFDLTEHQTERLCDFARKLVHEIYTVMEGTGFNDQVIALMGNRASVNLDGLL